MARDKFRHSGFHKIGDRYATFFDPGRFLGRNPFDDSWMAPHDLVIKNGKGHYEIQVALPGYKKDEIQVDVRNDRLTIRANAKRIVDKYKNFVEGPVSEKRMKSFQLGPEIDKDNIEARFENGLLTIRLPRFEKGRVQGKKKNIPIT